MALSVHIKKKLKDFELAVDFDMDEGIVGFLGSSGCGKSMTLKCIAGIETPDEGRIVLDDEVLFDKKSGINLSPQKRKVGYLFQNYALFPKSIFARFSPDCSIRVKSPHSISTSIHAENSACRSCFLQFEITRIINPTQEFVQYLRQKTVQKVQQKSQIRTFPFFAGYAKLFLS